ncbi:glucose-6-phosphate isomerase [Microbulbifer thermotolerans]|uniref:glucose-6-phosphate isomerase n=1 Tax=Microbulbifer thermotolerans TaxID=252514 RepID=UPI002248AFFE|nr:glucose-6-phosphate isomerase [Microbulbifer thermotolerans]MCX2784341.1 glucose-6-phosphate isomerase [Microbulbifer thermotolerans]MCX2796027.1 glucose-6-phosphate isomerase [Microbulbifer thermotolerans]MCX2831500.1 glucose-6-phosphate isomerase [Microbulbifer thermotolerans]
MTSEALTSSHTTAIAHLKSHQQQHKWSLRDLFASDNQRAQRFSAEAAGIYLDYSKNHLRDDTLQLLLNYAEQIDLPEQIQALLSGAAINNTEHRPALHSALRFQGEPQTEHEQAVADCREQMRKFTEQIHSGNWRGFTGKRIEHIVNIGIGGSDLGPRMVVEALRPWQKDDISVHFVANIDGADLSDTIAKLPAENTLFIVASKSFSTLETRQNALSARRWILDAGCPESDLAKHFVAVSSNIVAAQDFGIAAENIFPMWDWVGGRYSLWSAIGLPIALACGYETFEALLTGAHAMDTHFASAPLGENLPVLLALIHFWYRQCWGAGSQVILPYARRLAQFPAWMQQLDMESLGKGVTREGQFLSYPSGSVIWGTEGSNGQHSFHQLLHQGTDLIPADFIAVKEPTSELREQHQWLLSCCISQSQALLRGKSLHEARQELEEQGHTHREAQALAPHKVVPGNRPSNTLIIERLDPHHLGALLALYEHKVFTHGCLLGINPFDQWGVELGKLLGARIHEAIGKTAPEDWDSSTQTLLEKLF